MSHEINVLVRTQIIVVEPATGSVALVNAGPPGVGGGGGGGGAEDLNDLDDVIISAAVDGEVLTYNGSHWVNGEGSGGGEALEDHIADTSGAHTAQGINVVDPFGVFSGSELETVLLELFGHFNNLPTNSSSDPDKLIVQPVSGGVQELDVSQMPRIKDSGMVGRAYCEVNLAGVYTTPGGSFGEGSYLEASANGELPTIDGILYTDLNLNDIIVLGAQTEKGENGVYYITAKGTISNKWRLTRVPWLHLPSQFMKGFTVTIAEGVVFGGSKFYLITIPTNVNGTDDIEFAPVPVAGSGANGGVHGVSTAGLLGLPALQWGNGGIITGIDADTLMVTKALRTAGMPGATSIGRFVGVTESGAPTSGTFVVRDWVISQFGQVFMCTTGGTPGVWRTSDYNAADIWGPPPASGTRKGQSYVDAGAGAVSAKNVVAGRMYFVRIPLPRDPGPISNVSYQRTTPGFTLANCYLAAYSSSGTKLAQSVDLSTLWDDAIPATPVAETTALGFTPTWVGTDTYIYICLFVGSAGTPPGIGSAGSNALVNIGHASANKRFGFIAQTNTATLPSPVSSGSAGLALAAMTSDIGIFNLVLT